MKPVYASHHLRRSLENELLAAAESHAEVERAVSEPPEAEHVPRASGLRYRPFERLGSRH